jgi:hypothetical protein
MNNGSDPTRHSSADPRQSTLPGGTGTGPEDRDPRDDAIEDEARFPSSDVFDGGILDDPRDSDGSDDDLPEDDRMEGPIGFTSGRSAARRPG